MRRLGIRQWPYRKRTSTKKITHSLEVGGGSQPVQATTCLSCPAAGPTCLQLIANLSRLQPLALPPPTETYCVVLLQLYCFLYCRCCTAAVLLQEYMRKYGDPKKVDAVLERVRMELAVYEASPTGG